MDLPADSQAAFETKRLHKRAVPFTLLKQILFRIKYCTTIFIIIIRYVSNMMSLLLVIQKKGGPFVPGRYKFFD